MAYIKTSLGLPNNCSATGAPITAGYWYAASEDAARAGQGVCEAYAIENGLATQPDADPPAVSDEAQPDAEPPKAKRRKAE